MQAGEKASDLEISGYNLNGVKDRAGNAVNVSGAPHQPAGTLAVRGTSAATTAVSQPTTLAMAADIAAPASATTSVDPAAASQSTSNNWFGGRQSGGSDFSFGNRTTVAYPGANDGSVGVSAAQGTAMSRLALLDQYAASSFATPASTTGGPAAGLVEQHGPDAGEAAGLTMRRGGAGACTEPGLFASLHHRSV